MQKQADPTKSVLRSRRPVLIVIALAIAAGTWLAYTPAMHAGFSNWDDSYHVFDNPQLRRPLAESVKYYFGPHQVIGNYIPVTMLVYALEFKKAGLDPAFYHTINVAIHIVNALLVLWLVYLLSRGSVFIASLVSALFALQPMHVESVAWISELKDLLYTHAFLAGLIHYWYYLRSRRRYFLVFCFLCFTVSLLSKPAAIVFPFFLPLLDYHFRRRITLRGWLEKIPFVVLSVTIGIITLNMQSEAELLVVHHPIIHRIIFACHSLTDYAIKAVIPYRLSIFYPYPAEPLGIPTYYLSPLFVALMLFALYVKRKDTRWVFGILAFLLPLLPVLQLIPAGYAMEADRYTYLPYVGLYYLAGELLRDFFEKRPSSQRRALFAGTAVLCVVYAAATYSRCAVWVNDDTMATDLLQKFPKDPLALNNKGYIFYEQKRYADAIPLFKRALSAEPDYKRASINLANVYIDLNLGDSAMATADQALLHSPRDFNLLVLKAYLEAAHGDHTAAISFYKKAAAEKRDLHFVYDRLAAEYYHAGEYENSLAALDTCLRIQPANYITLNSKGYVLFLMGRYDEAMKNYEASLRIEPGYQTALANVEECRRVMQSAR